MAIDRGPWNALIDDDGSNLVGTVWNKDKIKTVLLDPIDAIPVAATWQAVPFSAANFSAASPMTWTVGSAAIIYNRYTVVGKILYWWFYISWFSGANTLSGTPSATLRMTLPGGYVAATGQKQLVTYTAGVAGVAAAAGLTINGVGTQQIEIGKTATGNFALSDVPGMITSVYLEIQ